MSERGIIMAADSVRAILAGRKTQTRRVYRPRNPEPWELPPGEGYKDDGTPWPMYQDTYGDFHPIRCPYGAPGDRLWVRESWTRWCSDEGCDKRGHIAYRADASAEVERMTSWRSPLHMPRWASRLTLEVVEVRVQRVQEISEQDAEAEGIERDEYGRAVNPVVAGLKTRVSHTAVQAYRHAWDAINGRRFPWSSNPWVWAVTFKRVDSAKAGRKEAT